MKGVGNMRRILGFICAILITVFAIIPNTYAEAQRDYGTLDMNRWGVFLEDEDRTVLIDKNLIDYKSDYKGNLLSNFWVCHFFTIENKMIMENITINYNERTIAVDAFVEYDKEGNLKNSETFSYPKYNKIIPGTVGEDLLNFFFPKEHIKEIEIYLKDKDQN